MRCSSYTLICMCVSQTGGAGDGRRQQAAARCTAWGHAFRTKHELFAHLRGPRLPPLLPVPSSEEENTTDKINYVYASSSSSSTLTQPVMCVHTLIILLLWGRRCIPWKTTKQCQCLCSRG